MTISTEKTEPNEAMLLWGKGSHLVMFKPEVDAYCLPLPLGGEEAVEFACACCGAVHYGRRCYTLMRCTCGNIIRRR